MLKGSPAWAAAAAETKFEILGSHAACTQLVVASAEAIKAATACQCACPLHCTVAQHTHRIMSWFALPKVHWPVHSTVCCCCVGHVVGRDHPSQQLFPWRKQCSINSSTIGRAPPCVSKVVLGSCRAERSATTGRAMADIAMQTAGVPTHCYTKGRQYQEQPLICSAADIAIPAQTVTLQEAYDQPSVISHRSISATAVKHTDKAALS